MKRIKTYAFVVILASLIVNVSVLAQTPTNLTKNNLIPKPVSVTSTGEIFHISGETIIYYQTDKDELRKSGQYLASVLKPLIGRDIQVAPADTTPIDGGFYFVKSQDKNLGDEGYTLEITRKLITLKANKPAGLFYAMQTLIQLVSVNSVENIEIPTGAIYDIPQYQHRGIMLDVARHFFSAEDVIRVIDYLAAYKMNVLHLHLSDDQGWRIEIKSWPNLTVIGGSTKVGGGEGGFYTQEQYAGIIKYSRENFVTIIPEIDMPGHTNAALASYAELNCNGKATKLYTGTNVGFSTLCTKNENTYKFIGDVFGELAALTPGPYIHMGGDESHVTKKEDYIPFVNRVQKIVASFGKKTIGWDDIANASLEPGTAIQFWANDKNTSRGIKQGAKVIISPAAKAYLDMKYDSTTALGLHWAGYIEVNTGYMWFPEKLVPGLTKENILGIEAPLWSETVTNLDEIEFMIFPRLPGYAEVGWSAPETRNWDDYKVRLGNHAKRFQAMGINFYHSPRVPWVE
jgi:hexosaminidase